MISVCPNLHLPNSLSLAAYNPIYHFSCRFQSLSDVVCRASILGWLVEMPLSLAGTAPLIGSFDLYNFKAKPHPFFFPSGKNSWVWRLRSALFPFVKSTVAKTLRWMVPILFGFVGPRNTLFSQGSYTKLALRPYSWTNARGTRLKPACLKKLFISLDRDFSYLSWDFFALISIGCASRGCQRKIAPFYLNFLVLRYILIFVSNRS